MRSAPRVDPETEQEYLAVTTGVASLRPFRERRHPQPLVSPPPSGVRPGSVEKSRQLYTEIASKIKKDYTGWRVAIFLSDKRGLVNFTAGLKRRTIRHGGLELTLLTGRIE